MQKTRSNIPAILRGEQRSNRYKRRHTLVGAAREIGIPTGWVWWWFHTKRLKTQTWLRRIWVCLEDVQKLFADLQAVYDAFYTTGEPLTSPEAIQQVLARWPGFPEQMYVTVAPKKPAASVIPMRKEKEA